MHLPFFIKTTNIGPCKKGSTIKNYYKLNGVTLFTLSNLENKILIVKWRGSCSHFPSITKHYARPRLSVNSDSSILSINQALINNTP